MKERILLVDDEQDIVEFLEYNLSNEGFDVVTAFNGAEAIEKMKSNPSLIILDVTMPVMDGYQACSRIRSMPGFESIPIMFLTAKSSELDEVHGLNIGADDFIQKPVSPKILIARVKSNLRKLSKPKNSNENSSIEVGPIFIDREKYKILVDGEEVTFPKKEFEILSYLAGQPGKVFPREKILNDIWGDDIYVVERTIDVHIRKIREKLDKYSEIIETVKGVGYRFKNFE